MKERVFLSNNQDGMIENYRMMHFLNVTDVLTNRVHCSGSAFNLSFFEELCETCAAYTYQYININTSKYSSGVIQANTYA